MPSSRQEFRSADAAVAAAAPSSPVSHIDAPRLDHDVADSAPAAARPVEIGGREGPEPTRFGDWERRGRCIDF